MSDLIEKINEIRQSVGPRKVETETVTVEQHDIEKLARIAERTTPHPTMATIRFTQVVPKDGCDCERR